MITLIDEATTTGESQGTSITQSQDTGQDTHSFQVVTTGSPTAVTIQILGTLDGSNYSELFEHTLTSTEIANGISMFHLIRKAVPKIKVNISTLTGGVSPTVSVYYFKGTL